MTNFGDMPLEMRNNVYGELLSDFEDVLDVSEFREEDAQIIVGSLTPLTHAFGFIYFQEAMRYFLHRTKFQVPLGQIDIDGFECLEEWYTIVGSYGIDFLEEVRKLEIWAFDCEDEMDLAGLVNRLVLFKGLNKLDILLGDSDVDVEEIAKVFSAIPPTNRRLEVQIWREEEAIEMEPMKCVKVIRIPG